MVVSDSCQGKGIGARLLKRCLDIAAEHKIKKVWGLVLAENKQMLALGRKLGFDIRMASGGREYELSLDIENH